MGLQRQWGPSGGRCGLVRSLHFILLHWETTGRVQEESKVIALTVCKILVAVVVMGLPGKQGDLLG